MKKADGSQHKPHAVGRILEEKSLRKGNGAFASPAEGLLAWYAAHQRQLPWRAKRGETADPYAVWLSEIMLQQTTVAAVIPYFRKFIERWPSVESLAAASLDDVLAAWSGLGYYARARNLHRAARRIVCEWGGAFPETARDLRDLPGVGTYTAGAIAAIAFDAREAAVDANAERVLARYFGVRQPLPAARPRLRQLAESLLPQKRSGDFAQAVMDLGAGICIPRQPLCEDCPWRSDCRAHAQGLANRLPRKTKRRARPLKRGAAFVLGDARGAVLLERRAPDGLLGGMLQPPMTAWGDNFPGRTELRRLAPHKASWRRAGVVRHSFTHFVLEIEVYSAQVARRVAVRSAIWMPGDQLEQAALPTLMRKILAHANSSARSRTQGSKGAMKSSELGAETLAQQIDGNQ